MLRRPQCPCLRSLISEETFGEVKAGDKLSAFRKLDADALYVKFTQDKINFYMSFDDILYNVTWFWYNFFSKKVKINIDGHFKSYTFILGQLSNIFF